MSFDGLLKQRGTILRRASGENVDELGGDTDAFVAIAEDVPCRKYISPSLRAAETQEAAGTQRQTRVIIDFLLDTDITAKDRFVLDGVTWNLLSVDPIAFHHLSATAEVFRG